VLLATLADASHEIASTAARSGKVARLAAVLADAAPDELPVAVAYLSGEPPQRRTGIGWRTLSALPPAASDASLTVAEVHATLDRVAGLSGAGSQTARREAVTELFARATAREQHFLGGLLRGELRQGALESLVVDAVAAAAGLPPRDVRRAVMLRGAVAPVAVAALTAGDEGLRQFRLEVGRPVQPMLAQPATGIAEAIERLGSAAVEWKLDGVRVQVHRAGDDIRVFTRTLDDVTARVPEVTAAVRALPVHSVVLDGETIALTSDGRPRPFQVTSSRVASAPDVGAVRDSVPLTCMFFDVLHVDGRDLLTEPAGRRAEALAAVAPAQLRVPRLLTSDVTEAGAFLDDALARGHEGVVVKSLEAPYDAGRRGAAWLKVKPVHTLDLVVLAAEWGSGRRRGWLSNLHLGARDEATGELVMLGKTFKGLTDAMLAWQTERLLQIEVSRNEWQVFVRPELVVEIAFDGVQTSRRYPGGMALRFARVLRHRPDKPAAEADTVDAVRAVHRRE
jgi:DNA ligase-1